MTEVYRVHMEVAKRDILYPVRVFSNHAITKTFEYF